MPSYMQPRVEVQRLTTQYERMIRAQIKFDDRLEPAGRPTKRLGANRPS